VIDTVTNSVVATIPIGSRSVGIAISPNGAFAYAANLNADSVSVINTTTNTVVATVPVGNHPSKIAFTPNGAFAYVTNNGTNDVSVIDTSTHTVVATVTVGAGPFGIAITPDTAPTNKEQCKGRGWRSFTNPVFRNQGECASFVQSNSSQKH
jgi:YVTN family beta-propeller protein